MEKRLQAVYKDGALQPLEPLPLEELQQVTVTITDPLVIDDDLAGYFTADEWAEAARDGVTWDDVRQAFSKITGALSETVLAQRQERWLPKYFLDTSALAKLYRKETGSDYMDRILREPGSRSLISRLSIVEMESVFAIKVRTGEIDQRDVEVARHHYQTARTLLARYGITEGLRTLDALQLAIPLDLRQFGLITVMVAADQKLCRVAELSGCSAVNPERPGPLL
jgi:predicted DNA-binding antitoxin AbrB/MazE fold protein/predicted nucleic acid-binding protein